MTDLDAVREHAETLTPGSPLRIAMDDVLARVEAQAAEIAALLAVRDRAAELNNRYVVENVDLRARVEALTAALREAEEELSIWKSVFPDIAPQSVLPDRSKVEAENVSLRALLEDGIACTDKVAPVWCERARAALAGKE